MPVLPEFEDSMYYLSKTGDLIFSTLPIKDPYSDPSRGIVRAWRFVDIGADPHSFFLFLLEAKKLGAKPSELIRIVTESRLDLQLPGVLRGLGISLKIL